MSNDRRVGASAALLERMLWRAPRVTMPTDRPDLARLRALEQRWREQADLASLKARRAFSGHSIRRHNDEARQNRKYADELAAVIREMEAEGEKADAEV